MGNPFTNKKQAEYWIKIIREKHDDFRTYVTDPALYSRLKLFSNNSKVLDAGCGEGYVSRWLSKKGHNVVGLDSSKYLIEAAENAKYGNEKYVLGNISNTNYKDNNFDAIVANFLLMDLEKPEKAIKEMSRILKPQGKMIFQILHPCCFTTNQQKKSGKIQDYFTSKIFEEKFNVNGLESPIPSVRYHHPISHYTKALHKYNFSINYLDEPKPIKKTPKDSFIHNLFSEPWILLMECIKK